MAPLTEKQEELLNDYDLRMLAEQFMVLRHTDTLSVSVLALSFTIFSLVIKPIMWPEHFSSKENSYISIATLNQPVVTLVDFCLFLLGFGVYLRRLVNITQKNMNAIHLRLEKRNRIPAEEFYFSGRLKSEMFLLRENATILSDIKFWPSILPSAILVISLLSFIALY